jgi:hypothetical protein
MKAIINVGKNSAVAHLRGKTFEVSEFSFRFVTLIVSDSGRENVSMDFLFHEVLIVDLETEIKNEKSLFHNNLIQYALANNFAV